MSYCRFHNTLLELQYCEEDLFDKISLDESNKRKKLILLCKKIAEQFDNEEKIDALPADDY